jgi:hypothetical protein
LQQLMPYLAGVLGKEGAGSFALEHEENAAS